MLPQKMLQGVAYRPVRRLVSGLTGRSVPAGGGGETPILNYTALESYMVSTSQDYGDFETYLVGAGQDYADFEAGNITEEDFAP